MADLYINEDNQSFYHGRPEEEMTAEGVDQVVDTTAQFPVTGIAFCVNVQRALFASKTWETFYSDYDPALGEEQPANWRRHGARNLWLLEQRGIDHHARWLARCRHHGIEGWLSMWMNDLHGLKEFAQGDSSGLPADHWTRHWASTMWREHPEWRRAPYRLERSWEGAFDFSLKVIYDHHMALLREICEKYDMYGLELDWLRWGMMFAPGGEQAGIPILNQFVRDVKQLVDASAARVGHPVKLAVRVPAEPASCLALAFDVPQWVDEGLVDMVILSQFLGCANFDYPVSIWRRLLGPDVKLIANAEPVVGPYPETDQIVGCKAFTLGSAASALQRGVDGIHLFNHCPSVLQRKDELAASLGDLYSTVSDLEAIKQLPRRQAVTYPQIYAPGESSRSVLPQKLQNPVIGVGFGRMEHNITLRIMVGPKPTTGKACLQLGFSEAAKSLTAADLTVRVNRTIVPPTGQRPEPFVKPPEDVLRTDFHGEPSAVAAHCLLFDVPLDALHDDVNVVEFEPPRMDGELVWADLLISPDA